MEITRKMTQVRTPLEFLRVFFPADTVKNRWTNMVNESVQNAWRAGRTETDAERPNFTAATANQRRLPLSLNKCNFSQAPCEIIRQ